MTDQIEEIISIFLKQSPLPSLAVMPPGKIVVCNNAWSQLFFDGNQNLEESIEGDLLERQLAALGFTDELIEETILQSLTATYKTNTDERPNNLSIQIPRFPDFYLIFTTTRVNNQTFLIISAIPEQLQKTTNFISHNPTPISTELKKLKNYASRQKSEINRLKSALESATTTNSRFMQSMGHEYRTPLSSILGLLELALLQTIPDEVRRYIVEAQNSARELLTTVSDIIEFTELETSHFVNRPKRFSLKNLLDRIISLVTRQANEKRVVIASRVSDSVSSFVTADEQRIGQILLNTMLFVLENATPRGGIVIFVDNLSDPLVADIGSATIGISIGYWDDTISDDSVKRLFATITNSQEKWIGSALIPRLRLSLVARVIDCLGGGINLHHVPRCGLRIEVRIPVSVEVEEDLTSPRIESELIDPELSKNLRVLVAEDNAVNARVITHMLEHLNTPFVLVQNGAEAVRAFEHDIKGFDLILMDCQMPEFDGFEATKAIRLIEQERHTHTPIIAMTAYALPGDRELCYQAGMDGYLSKPISAKQLSSTLQSSK